LTAKFSPPRVVLVVDDEPIVLQMMARALLDAGYAVHAASNGPDALALAGELPRPPDLVVTDIRMEPMGGTELGERLFSGGLASCFGPFLPNPFLPGRLVEEVTHLIG
jgi:CheY-like chemotaxis protein